MAEHRFGDDPFQDLFEESVTETGHLDARELGYLHELFDTGFTHKRGEGIGHNEMREARETFFAELGMDPGSFDWEGWREAMGYTD